MFYEHVDTRLSSLSYIKLKRLDNDIKTKSFSRTCTDDETKGKPRKKSVTSRYQTRMHNKNSVCMERNNPTPKPLGYRAIDITERYNLYSTSGLDMLVASKQQREIVKLQKYAFLKQNIFNRIDELPHHSSLFYKLNFVSRRQFFINIGKYPSNMQKVRNDPLLYNKIFKRVALFPY